ncbi:IS3 family transposase [Bacillus sp. RG28]|uniref:IS3 family transposase n=1 Tax=Gottfriedia endophytica TaxID=2820819 RepID=A0A940NN46_9BACI|nr:IS3 family transposase [Gottfriedia endophytica]MBP0723847.1 IS3 family transposase [Gottfriedia endophytica]
MTKISLNQKLTAIQKYLDGQGSYSLIGKSIGVRKKIVQTWVAFYNEYGVDGLISTYTKYPIELKMDVLKYMNDTGASVLETAVKFRISSPSSIEMWRKKFEEHGIDALYPKKKGRPPMKKQKKNTYIPGSQEALQAENERLRAENAYLKKLHGLNSRKRKITNQIKAQIISELRSNFSLSVLLEVTDIPRATYYYWVKNMKQPDKYSQIKEMITKIYRLHKRRYGYRRITLELHKRGYQINHKAVLRLMNELGLKATVRAKKYRSYQGKVGKIAPNILERNFTASNPNEKWVTDITEFQMYGEKLYLSPILDLYNGEIIAYSINKRPVFQLVYKMLKQGLSCLNDGDKPILHSDQGWHYQMRQYREILKQNNIKQSMSRKGNCLDNAVIENFFGLLKSELLYNEEFSSMDQFIEKLHEYIHYYNHERIKIKLKGLSPVQYRVQSSLAA